MKKLIKFLFWQRVPASQIQFKNLQKETTSLLVYAFSYVLLAILIAYTITQHPLPILNANDFIQDFWYAGVFKFTFLLIIPLWIFFKLWRYTFQNLLLGLKPSIPRVIKGALLMALGFFLNTKHLEPIASQIPNYPDAPMRLMIGVILPLFIAGIPEELFFRAMLQTRLEKLWNTTLAILVSGILFTAWHIPSRFFLAEGVDGQAGDLISVLVGTGLPVFIVGAFFGWHWSRFRNLPALILTHWAIDILPSVSSFFGISF